MVELPTELLLHVLQYLDFREILRCKQVCKCLDSIIQNDMSLEYKIQLGFNGLEDSDARPSLSLNSRFTMLQHCQQNWESLRFSDPNPVGLECDGVWELQGNILSQAKDDGTLHFVQLPSPARSMESQSWKLTFSTLGINGLHDYAMDPTQDLLVLFVEPPEDLDDGSIYWYIYFRTLSTGEPHPLAASSKIEMVGDRVGDCICQNIQISSIYLGGYFLSDLKDEFRIWNWVTGKQHLECNEQLLAYAFLTDHHCAFIPADTTPTKLTIVDISKTPDLISLDYFSLSADTCTFHFPQPKEELYVEEGEIRMNPIHPTVPCVYNHFLHPFQPAQDQCIIEVLLNYVPSSYGQSSDFRQIRHMVPLDRLRPYIEKMGNNHIEVPWEEWGPNHTRALVMSGEHSSTWLRNVYGMRFIEMLGSDILFMVDFNQYAIRKAFVDLETSQVMNTKWTIVDQASILTNTPYIDPLITRLPFRISHMPLPKVRDDFMGAMFSGDNIVLVIDSPESTQYYTLSIQP